MKKNDKKKQKTKKVTKPTAIILLDKLIFSCISTVEDNFNHAVMRDPEYWHTELPFGKTKLERTVDPSNRYRHSYAVHYGKWLMGRIDFGLYNYGIDPKKLLRFTVYNEVFSKDRLKYIPAILDDLNLNINNFTQIDIVFNKCVYIRNSNYICGIINCQSNENKEIYLLL